MSRLLRRKQKKKKKTIILLSVICTIIIIPAIYFAMEYYEGYSKASESSILDTEEISFDGDAIEEKMNILLVGVDAREEGPSNSDTIMIAQYDPDKKKAKLVSVLRDIYVEIPGQEEKQKINSAYMIGGVDLLRKTIKETFEIDLHYYAIIDFNGFIKAIDTGFPEGIEINVQKRMSEGIWQTIEPGLQQLNGKQLLGYARYRNDAKSDFGRAERQQEVLEALTEEMMSMSGLMKIPGIVGSLRPYVATNMSNSKLIAVMTSYLSSGDKDVDKLVLPLVDQYENRRIEIHGREQEVLDMDVTINKEAIRTFLGEKQEKYTPY